MKKSFFLLLVSVHLYLTNTAQTIDQIKDETIRSIRENDPIGQHGFVYDTSLNCNDYSRPESWECFRLSILFYDSLIRKDLKKYLTQRPASKKQEIIQSYKNWIKLRDKKSDKIYKEYEGGNYQMILY